MTLFEYIFSWLSLIVVGLAFFVASKQGPADGALLMLLAIWLQLCALTARKSPRTVTR